MGNYHGIDKNTYNFQRPNDKRTVLPKDVRSLNNLAALTEAAQRAEDDLGAKVNHFDTGSVRTIEVSTAEAAAIGTVNFGGDRGYFAKVMLRYEGGDRQLSVESGAEKAENAIYRHLQNPSAEAARRASKKKSGKQRRSKSRTIDLKGFDVEAELEETYADRT